MQQGQKKRYFKHVVAGGFNDQTNFLDCIVAHLLQIKDLSDGRLHLHRFLCHQTIEVNFNFAAVMVDRLLVLDKASQVLDVSL